MKWALRQEQYAHVKSSVFRCFSHETRRFNSNSPGISITFEAHLLEALKYNKSKTLFTLSDQEKSYSPNTLPRLFVSHAELNVIFENDEVLLYSHR